MQSRDQWRLAKRTSCGTLFPFGAFPGSFEAPLQEKLDELLWKNWQILLFSERKVNRTREPRQPCVHPIVAPSPIPPFIPSLIPSLIRLSTAFVSSGGVVAGPGRLSERRSLIHALISGSWHSCLELTPLRQVLNCGSCSSTRACPPQDLPPHPLSEQQSPI